MRAVSQIATFGTMAAKAVVRDVGRVLDLGYNFCDQLAKLIPFQPGKLITLDRKVKSAQGRLKMCNIKPEILEVFQITKLNKVFDIRAGEAEAIAAF